MTKIDFYQLKSGRFSPDKALCGLCLKAHQHRQSTLLLTQSEQESQRLDLILWHFEDTSFIPHSITRPNYPLSKIHINHQALANEHYDILINTSSAIPDHIGQFSRIIELVHDDNKNIARTHYRYYKDRGYPVNHENI